MFAKVTGQLQSIAKEIIGIPNNIEATCVRSGGIQEMVAHQDVTTFDSSCRSGHLNMMAAICRTYEYTHATASAVLIGGMAGGGYVRCRGKVCTASLIFFPAMSAQDQMGMTNLLEKLFSSDIDFGEAKRNLYFCMFATFLMHLETFVSTVICIYIHIYISINIYTYIYIYGNICIYLYIYIYI
jgi:hypothetical protein